MKEIVEALFFGENGSNRPEEFQKVNILKNFRKFLVTGV